MLVVVAGLAAWAATQITSPEQAAAEAEAPPPSTITAPVERRTLTQTITIRGGVATAGVDVHAVVADPGFVPVITDVRVSEDSTVGSGDVLVTVAGRPIIALTGALPPYRDIRPGDVGPDVEQLQAALGALGHPAGGDPAGTFGPGTQRAVERFYRDAGFEATATSPDVDKVLSDASRRVADAQDALAAARAAGDPGAVEDAEAALSRARDAQTLTGIEQANTLADAAAAVSAARDALDAAHRSEDRAVAATDVAVRQAAADVAAAEAARDEAVAGGDEAEIADAEAALARARDAQTLTGIEQANSLADAAAAVERAQEALDTAHRNQARAVTAADIAVRQAAEDVAAAEATLAAAVAARDDPAANAAAVGQAERALAAAREDYARIRSTEGVYVPRGEIVFVPGETATVAELSAQVGAVASADTPLFRLSVGTPSVRGLLQPGDRELVRPGMTAMVRDPVGGQERPAEVTEVGNVPIDDPVLGSGYVVVLSFVEPVPSGSVPSEPVVDIVTGSTPTEVLAVPVAALSGRADGSTTVDVLAADGTIRTVPVSAGLSADGFVEVTPRTATDLAEGDEVIVGIAPSG